MSQALSIAAREKRLFKVLRAQPALLEWAAANWDLRTLAAAIANERAKRDAKPTNLSDAELAKLRAEIDAAHQPLHPPDKPGRTTRIVRTTPGLPQRPPKRANEFKA